MVGQKTIDIESVLPASRNPPTGKVVVHDPAVFEVDIMAKFRTANRLIVVLLYHVISPPDGEPCTCRTRGDGQVHGVSKTYG
jgi:hypothetical protein